MQPDKPLAAIDPDDLRCALKHVYLMRTGEWEEPSWLSRAEATALHLHIEALTADRDAYRIEADCGLRDYDALELRYGQLLDAVKAARPKFNYSGMGF